MLHIYNMFQGSLTIIVEIGNSTSWVLAEMNGGATDTWKKFSFQVNIKQAFSLLLEAVSGPMPGHVAIDNIRLINCYPGNHASNVCSPHNFHCNDGVCLQSYQLCDLKRDCQDGEDEEQECDKIPPTGRCDFENGLCGWHNNSNLGGLFFETLSGKAPNDRTGPSYDHTYENETGVYAFVNVARAQMADSAKLRSAIYNPPPPCHSNTSAKSCVNTCAIQFYFYKSGIHSGVLALYLYEEEPKHKETHKTKLVWLYGEHDDRWLWFRTILPPVTHQYYLQFEVSRGISIKGDVAIDDISLSRECFGIGIPKEELGNYNYSSYKFGLVYEAHKSFNITYYTLTSCGLEGREGPKQKDCDLEYQKTPQTKVKVLSEPPLAGAQLWKVPEDGTYTFIVKGASGGRGSTYDVGHSYGAVVRGVMELSKGQKIFALVGKKGSNACKKHVSSGETSSCVPPLSTRKVEGDKIRELQKLETLTGGGGGGGATYVFTTNEKGHPVPLIVAAGGGGLANVILTEKTHQYGHGLRLSSLPYSGIEYGNNSAGGGGGWARNLNSTRREVSGMSFLKGALGGKACYYSTDGKGDGGFGGGGGGCSAGGGGGGYIGGSAWNNSQDNGEGGYSYASANVKMREFEDDVNFGSGSVIIIPAVEGCGCDYLCVALDEYRHIVQCICPNGWFIDRDNVTCISTPPVLISHLPTWAYIVGGVSISICGFLFALGTVWIYNRLQRRKMDGVRKRMMDGPELQLNRLREASNNMLSEINPNYEFGGVNYSVRDLPQVPRDHLRLVKALGQGAFGEVYQGFYRHRVGDAVEMPVAVKTLPELSTTQAENDFVMEALIMHKFNHPNIVHFIGVCFDKHPRFIVLELLAGGDLKSFLRESRPKPEKPSALTMKDLILCAIDLAKGCKYLEGARFIHRDIAARNCLLTTKGPGRVVKIADFGMARDIYRSDYYRKGGKTMLPIKWMPPEAFMDGVFTAKTDVWSFGVVLWEIMSLGYMPYTGCANRDVMTWVSSGGRLEAPNNCPTQIYAIMRMCWEHEPANRPCFSTIQDRLTYCLQDPEVLNNPLPVFHKAPSAEKDITIMRLPENGDSSCLHVQRASDYLVPVPPPVVTPDITSSPSASSVDKLLANPIVWESSNCVLPVAHSPKPLMNHHESNHIGEISKISISDGNIVQIDKISIPDGKIVHSEKTTPNSVPKNKNNNNNNPHGNIGSNLPLDPANLVKPPLQYVSVGISPTCSAQVPSELQTQLADGLSFTIDEAANRRLPSETEISC